jgi:hypothetical protein
MSAKDVVAAVKAAGLPVAHVAWPVGSAPALPWCVYLIDEDGKLSADDSRWCSLTRWSVELYSKQGDEESAPKLEAALTAAFGDYSKEETWVESESCVMTSYLFTEIGD